MRRHRRRVLGYVLSGAVAAGLIAAAPASATSFDTFARQHLLSNADVPSTGLGDLGPRRVYISPASNSATGMVCGGHNRGITIAGVREATASFARSDTGVPQLNEDVVTFASPAAARRAFERVARQSRQCEGSRTGGQGSLKSRYTTAWGAVPEVTVAGVPSFSLGTTTSRPDSSAPGGWAVSQEVYNVYTLARDVIITITYTLPEGPTGPPITAAQRQLVNQTAATAASRWIG